MIYYMFLLQAMEALIPLGIVKAIGVSNFTITKLESLLSEATIIPAVNQGIYIVT